MMVGEINRGLYSNTSYGALFVWKSYKFVASISKGLLCELDNVDGLMILTRR